jgi:DnaJ-class molecular chaperone
MDKEINTYSAKNCLCRHCDFSGEVILNKGVLLDQAVCPTCGNKGGLYKKPQTTSYYKF